MPEMVRHTTILSPPAISGASPSQPRWHLTSTTAGRSAARQWGAVWRRLCVWVLALLVVQGLLAVRVNAKEQPLDHKAITLAVETPLFVATLSGLVDDWAEQRAAIENAYEGGALSVRDELTVKGGSAE